MAKGDLSKESLREAALQYVGRRETTRSHLRQVLRRRVRNFAARHGRAPADAEGWIEEILDGLEEGCLVDDRRYAALRAGALSRRGRSRRAIEATLREKGVAPSDVTAALERWAENEPEAEWRALERYAKRRKLGPFRLGPQAASDFSTRSRDQRALLRAGFDLALVHRLLNGEE